jgi:DNA-binding NarL/FixJ family response regulator
VVVFGQHTLFTEGIAARLGQRADQVDLIVVDSRQVDALAQAIAAQPEVVLMEAGDERLDRPCPWNELLDGAPQARILRLDPDQARIRVVTSEHRTIEDPADLINMVLAPL